MSNDNKAQIQEVIENWCKAVRKKDFDSILAHHAEDIVMFDVPPPFQSKGIDAYKKTWDLFYSCEQAENSFRVADIHVIAGEEVAFC